MSTKKKNTPLVHSLLVVLLVAYGGGWDLLCGACGTSAQAMVCHVGAEGSAMASVCCCGAALCGEVEVDAPSLPAVELPTDASLLLGVSHAMRPLRTRRSVRSVAPTIQPTPPPLFQLHCSLLI